MNKARSQIASRVKVLPFGEDLGGANKAAIANPVDSLKYE